MLAPVLEEGYALLMPAVEDDPALPNPTVKMASEEAVDSIATEPSKHFPQAGPLKQCSRPANRRAKPESLPSMPKIAKPTGGADAKQPDKDFFQKSNRRNDLRGARVNELGKKMRMYRDANIWCCERALSKKPLARVSRTLLLRKR